MGPAGPPAAKETALPPPPGISDTAVAGGPIYTVPAPPESARPPAHKSVGHSEPRSKWCGLVPQGPDLGQQWLDTEVAETVVQLPSHARLFATPWIAARQASLAFTISWTLLKLMSIELMMSSNHLIFCQTPSPPALNLSQHQGLFQ